MLTIEVAENSWKGNAFLVRAVDAKRRRMAIYICSAVRNIPLRPTFYCPPLERTCHSQRRNAKRLALRVPGKQRSESYPRDVCVHKYYCRAFPRQQV
jgi:hypothetical protein